MCLNRIRGRAKRTPLSRDLKNIIKPSSSISSKTFYFRTESAAMQILNKLRKHASYRSVVDDPVGDRSGISPEKDVEKKDFSEVDSSGTLQRMDTFSDCSSDTSDIDFTVSGTEPDLPSPTPELSSPKKIETLSTLPESDESPIPAKGRTKGLPVRALRRGLSTSSINMNANPSQLPSPGTIPGRRLLARAQVSPLQRQASMKFLSSREKKKEVSLIDVFAQYDKITSSGSILTIDEESTCITEAGVDTEAFDADDSPKRQPQLKSSSIAPAVLSADITQTDPRAHPKRTLSMPSPEIPMPPKCCIGSPQRRPVLPKRGRLTRYASTTQLTSSSCHELPPRSPAIFSSSTSSPRKAQYYRNGASKKVLSASPSKVPKPPRCCIGSPTRAPKRGRLTRHASTSVLMVGSPSSTKKSQRNARPQLDGFGKQHATRDLFSEFDEIAEKKNRKVAGSAW